LTTGRQYFYLFINIGALVGQIGMTYAEKNVGFWLAYLLPTLVFCLCPFVLWVGYNRYNKSPPGGSVLAGALRIIRYGMRGRWSLNPIKSAKALQSQEMWDSAKPSQVGAARPAWMTFDDQWVDEVKRGFKACVVFVWFPIYCASLCPSLLHFLRPLTRLACRAHIQPAEQ
jgi:POT family proton-dependent oligopeptide transporter